MWHMAHTEKTFAKDIFCILVSKRTRSCSVNTSLVTNQIFFTKSKCSKQELTSCVMPIIPNFLAGFVQKMYMTKIMLLNVTSLNFGFILNVTILII